MMVNHLGAPPQYLQRHMPAPMHDYAHSPQHLCSYSVGVSRYLPMALKGSFTSQGFVLSLAGINQIRKLTGQSDLESRLMLATRSEGKLKVAFVCFPRHYSVCFGTHPKATVKQAFTKWTLCRLPCNFRRGFEWNSNISERQHY